MSNKNFNNESEKPSKLNPKDITMMLENFLQPPTDDEIQQLEKNILKDGGIRDPLVIWKNGNQNILVDGIIRHRIALKHNLECPIVYYDFPSIEDVKIFVVTNQLGRRNLTKFYRSELILQLEDYYKELGRKNQSKGGEGCQISDKETIDTKKILGKKADVSHDTIAKVKKISETVKDPETLKELRQGNRTINGVYNKLTGKEPKPETIQQQLFDQFGGLIPDMSTLKSLTIIPTKDGSFKVEAITKENQKLVHETLNQIMVAEIKPKPDSTEDMLDILYKVGENQNNDNESVNQTMVTETEPELVPVDEKLLHVSYEEYDFSSILNPYYEDLRTLFIRETLKLDKSVWKKMDKNSAFLLFAEKLQLELLKNWNEKHQPLGGGRKTSEKIISELKRFKDIDPSTILMSDDSGQMNVLNTGKRLTSGINQYFHEMMDTPTASGKSPMDVIKDKDVFIDFLVKVIVNDRMHLFVKSPEYKSTKLKNAA